MGLGVEGAASGADDGERGLAAGPGQDAPRWSPSIRVPFRTAWDYRAEPNWLIGRAPSTLELRCQLSATLAISTGPETQYVSSAEDETSARTRLDNVTAGGARGRWRERPVRV